MKIDSPVVGRVGAPNTIAQYTQGNAPRGGEAVAAGLGNLASGVQQLHAAFQQQDDSLNRFNSLRGFSDFQTKVTTSLAEAKRGYQSDGQGFTKAASDLYDKEAEAYISTVPAQLQPEFRYRIGETKRSVVADSLDFQYKQGDAWFNQGVKDELDKSKNILDKQPEMMDSQREHIFQTIDATNLPQNQKDQLKHDASISLESATYRADVRSNAVKDATVGPIGSAVDKIMGAEGSGPQSWGGSKASGYGQFIPSTWLRVVSQYRPDLVQKDANGNITNQKELLDMRDDKSLGREMTTHLTEESAASLQASGLPATDGNLYLMHFLGAGDAPKVLRANPATPLSAIVQPASMKANPFLANMTAGDVRSWAANKMGGRATSVDDDPKYANIPLEDRWALQSQANQQAASITADTAAAQKAMVDTNTNSLYVGLMDGSKGQPDIDAARQAGWLSSYASINQANNILEERNKHLDYANQGSTNLQNPNYVWAPGEDSQKQLNAVVKQGGGVDRIAGRDDEYFDGRVLPMVSQTAILPSSVADTLTGMVRQGDQQSGMWALDALAQIRDHNEFAYNNGVPKDVQDQVDRWDVLKDSSQDQNVVWNSIRGGADQASRQLQTQLGKEAQGILSQTTSGVSNAKTLLAGALGGFESGSRFFDAAMPTAPAAAQVVQNEFNRRFIENYKIVGDETKAANLSVKQMSRDWAQTQVGTPDLMKYPPEKYYKPIEGTYDWINKQVLERVNAIQFRPPQDLSTAEQSLLQYSRDNMNSGNIIKDADGNVTSVYITGVTGPDGRIYNVPGYKDGKMLTPEEAHDNAAAQGWDKFPAYPDGPAADAAAEHIHSYIDEDNAYFTAREGAPKITNFQLFSDAQTEAEVNAHKQPSYQVFTIDENGVPTLWSGTNGQAIRTSFDPPKEALARQDAIFRTQAELHKLQETQANFDKMNGSLRRQALGGTVLQMPPEEIKANEIAKKREEQIRRDPANPFNQPRLSESEKRMRARSSWENQ